MIVAISPCCSGGASIPAVERKVNQPQAMRPASSVVPAKRFYFPPYSFAANYYWPEKPAAAAKGAGKP